MRSPKQQTQKMLAAESDAQKMLAEQKMLAKEKKFAELGAVGQQKLDEGPAAPAYFVDSCYPFLQPNNPNHQDPILVADDEESSDEEVFATQAELNAAAGTRKQRKN